MRTYPTIPSSTGETFCRHSRAGGNPADLEVDPRLRGGDGYIAKADFDIRPKNGGKARRCAATVKGAATLAVLLLSLYPGKSAFSETGMTSVAYQSKADCEISKGPCTKKLGSVEVTLDIRPKPVRAMRENSFMVRIRPDLHPLPEKITIDLGMPGMYMGNNVVTLSRQVSGLYSGTGIIPRCPSGGRLWRATVNIPEDGKVEFFFDVVY